MQLYFQRYALWTMTPSKHLTMLSSSTPCLAAVFTCWPKTASTTPLWCSRLKKLKTLMSRSLKYLLTSRRYELNTWLKAGIKYRLEPRFLSLIPTLKEHIMKSLCPRPDFLVSFGLLFDKIF